MVFSWNIVDIWLCSDWILNVIADSDLWGIHGEIILFEEQQQ